MLLSDNDKSAAYLLDIETEKVIDKLHADGVPVSNHK